MEVKSTCLTNTAKFISVCKSSFMRSSALFWPPRATTINTRMKVSPHIDKHLTGLGKQWKRFWFVTHLILFIFKWADGVQRCSGSKSTCYSSTRPKSGSQHPHGGLTSASTSNSEGSLPSFDLRHPHTTVAYE